MIVLQVVCLVQDISYFLASHNFLLQEHLWFSCKWSACWIIYIYRHQVVEL